MQPKEGPRFQQHSAAYPTNALSLHGSDAEGWISRLRHYVVALRRAGDRWKGTVGGTAAEGLVTPDTATELRLDFVLR